MHSNFCGGAFSDDPMAPVANHIFELLITHLSQDFGECCCGAAWRILLGAMVHFENFQIEARPENLGRFSGQPKKHVDTG